MDSGYFGYGIDYYYSYKISSYQTDNIWDFIGWKVSTMELFNKNIGVFLTSFFLSMSSGIFIRYYLKYINLDSLIFFLIVYIILIFSWPIINLTSNAMRQGLSMSFIFFSLIAFLNNNKILTLILLIIVTFTHKSGIFFVLISIITFSYMTCIKYIYKRNKIKFLNKLIVLFGFFTFILVGGIIYLLQFFQKIALSAVLTNDNIPIGYDFTILFLLISIFYIIFFILKSKIFFKNFINIFLFNFSCGSIAIFLFGLYWQYERLMMTMIIPYIVLYSTFFTIKSAYLYLLISYFILFIITLLTGMYDIGVGFFYVS
jgi:hypothetical protein